MSDKKYGIFSKDLIENNKWHDTRLCLWLEEQLSSQ